MRATIAVGVIALLLAACDGDPEKQGQTSISTSTSTPTSTSTSTSTSTPTSTSRVWIDGKNFPEKVLSLTWDDGPDRNTLKLAELLHDAHVSATFFVVGEWIDDLSMDPGWGKGVFETGHRFLPVLGDLVALGHRVANHTLHHVLLSEASPSLFHRELAENQAQVDPFLLNELPLFRAPGGAWNEKTTRAIDADKDLSRLVGPVSWDIDEKDWENAVYALCKHPQECEPGPHGPRVKARVTAKAYLDAIESRKRGVVLLHDRVGDVGSEYALDVARILVPELLARGYVFAAPVLHFSPLSARMSKDAWPAVDPASLVLIDVDGDGRADACAMAASGVVCAVSDVTHDEHGAPRVVLRAHDDQDELARASAYFSRVKSINTHTGDLNGDGRDDSCALTPAGISCALTSKNGPLQTTVWLDRNEIDRDSPPFALGDVNGDGRADLCAMASGELRCAMAP